MKVEATPLTPVTERCGWSSADAEDRALHEGRSSLNLNEFVVEVIDGLVTTARGASLRGS